MHGNGSILGRMPETVRSVLASPIDEVLQGRSGALLWFGAIVGLWTAASFIETIRDILRRAYGVKYSASFWQYRLASMAVILGAVVLLFIAFGVTVILTSVHQFVIAKLPFSEGLAHQLGLYRIFLYVLMLAEGPSRAIEVGGSRHELVTRLLEEELARL